MAELTSALQADRVAKEVGKRLIETLDAECAVRKALQESFATERAQLVLRYRSDGRLAERNAVLDAESSFRHLILIEESELLRCGPLRKQWALLVACFAQQECATLVSMERKARTALVASENAHRSGHRRVLDRWALEQREATRRKELEMECDLGSVAILKGLHRHLEAQRNQLIDNERNSRRKVLSMESKERSFVTSRRNVELATRERFMLIQEELLARERLEKESQLPWRRIELLFDQDHRVMVLVEQEWQRRASLLRGQETFWHAFEEQEAFHFIERSRFEKAGFESREAVLLQQRSEFQGLVEEFHTQVSYVFNDLLHDAMMQEWQIRDDLQEEEHECFEDLLVYEIQCKEALAVFDDMHRVEDDESRKRGRIARAEQQLRLDMSLQLSRLLQELRELERVSELSVFQTVAATAIILAVAAADSAVVERAALGTAADLAAVAPVALPTSCSPTLAPDPALSPVSQGGESLASPSRDLSAPVVAMQVSTSFEQIGMAGDLSDVISHPDTIDEVAECDAVSASVPALNLSALGESLESQPAPRGPSTMRPSEVSEPEWASMTMPIFDHSAFNSSLSSPQSRNGTRGVQMLRHRAKVDNKLTKARSESRLPQLARKVATPSRSKSLQKISAQKPTTLSHTLPPLTSFSSVGQVC
eukprot:NODE_346_length_2404_cov_26.061571_g321_i0.p1 GENE.NODE_346_length_2404_cov_26.061571_g321_i0~~NODE_346_length_2404_cov_26.061571_g321_i0.p1  ORF type:complete len:732 (+),score=153.29 NODE_346_length_2404_cov_26.061571_g321_i0:234-2198(+)